jgi:hypothetical protein
MSTWRCGNCGTLTEAQDDRPPGTATMYLEYRNGRDLAGCGKPTTWRLVAKPTPVARRTDPATSHAAARSVGDTGTIRARILELIRTEGPVTDEELVELIERRHPGTATPSGIRTRRKELVDMGYLEDSGQRDTTRAGRQAAIWQPNGYRRPA